MDPSSEIHISHFFSHPHWFMCFISWLTRCEGWKNKASNDGWMIACVRRSNSSSQTHTNVFRGLSRWRWLRVRSLAWDPEFLAGRTKAASHQKFFFLLNIGFARLWVCVVVFLRVRSCLPAVVLGWVAQRFSFLVLFVFFLFISSQAHVAKLAVKSLYRGPSPNFRSVNIWSS